MDLLRTIRNMLLTAISPFARKFHPGHYYSPLPDIKEIERVGKSRLAEAGNLAGIELNETRQLKLLGELAKYNQEFPYQTGRHSANRYFHPNSYFPLGDAAVLFAMLRYYRPQKVYEIGSGFSSAVMLDARELYFPNGLELAFIDPHPERLKSLCKPGDLEQVQLVASFVQDTPLEFFDELSAGDMLFVDSSHVSKFGSDLNFLLFHVLPRLQNGVLVHFHDIYWPFEYPLEIFRQGIAWNENYLIHAFLQFNQRYKPLLFMQYLLSKHWPVVNENMPVCTEYGAVSLWLESSSE